MIISYLWDFKKDKGFEKLFKDSLFDFKTAFTFKNKITQIKNK